MRSVPTSTPSTWRRSAWWPRRARGNGGLGLFSHSDTVPGDAGWEPFSPTVADGRLLGRGSADMKGPLAASIAAACRFNAADLERPLVIAVTADEERGHTGAHDIVERSQTLTSGWPQYCIVCEPSTLQPVYAHKGGAGITVTARGVAAHTSTDKGMSANFKIAPFLAEMTELAQTFRAAGALPEPAFRPADERLQSGDQRRRYGDERNRGADGSAPEHPGDAGRLLRGGRADGCGAGRSARPGSNAAQHWPVFRRCGRPAGAGGLSRDRRAARGHRPIRHRKPSAIRTIWTRWCSAPAASTRPTRSASGSQSSSCRMRLTCTRG